MPVPTFALEVWMHPWETRPPRHNLVGSTGPGWTLAEVLALDGLTVDALADDALGYAPITGSDELRAAVAAHTGAAPEHVQITTGAAEGLAMLVAAHGAAGDNVVFPTPGYPPFGALPEIFDREGRPYALRREDGFRLDTQRVIDLIDDRTGVVIVNTPNNPTGTLVDAEQMRAVRDACERHGARLVIDQVQHPIEHARPSASGTAIEGATVIGDMSKAMSMPGVRVGWIIDPEARRRARYFDLRGFFTISTSPLGERLAAIALRHRDRVLARAQRVGSANLTVLRSFFARHTDRLRWVEPEGGLIAFPWILGEPSSRPLCEDLTESGILLAPGDCFGHPEHFRLGFGSSEPAAFAESIEALEQAIAARTVTA